jgi:hypothetical protein
MQSRERPERVKEWFQAAIAELWPVATGSISLRRSPCIRKQCRLCETGEGHPSYALYGRNGKQRFVIYVPDELAPEVERAVHNGRRLQELIAEAGQRYTLALKYERRSRRKSRG